jgi:hypothetical protein
MHHIVTVYLSDGEGWVTFSGDKYAAGVLVLSGDGVSKVEHLVQSKKEVKRHR